MVAGDGAAGLFAEAGATVLRRGPGDSPTAAAMHDAIRRVGDEVAVLPNEESNRTAVEEAAGRARAHGRHVSVVPKIGRAHV